MAAMKRWESRNKQMKRRQSEQFVALWTAAQPTIMAFIRTLTPDLHQAEEVLQRVAVQLVRKFDQYDPNRPFAAWAIGFAKKEVLYYRRQRAHDKHRFADDIVERLAVTYEQMITEIDPMRGALAHCVEELEDRSRQVLELYYGRSMACPAIAAKLGMSHGAVRMLLSRVRAWLRQCIESRVGPLNPEAGA
jgi:RNA polymerase sigma-70 factor (ECF subfamily)